MKKTLLLSILISFLLGGCFYPFSTFTTQKKEVVLPKNGPEWLINSKKEGYLTQIGITNNIDKKEFDFHKKRALIKASHKLTKKIYIKVLKLYKDYEGKTNDALIYDKDIKKSAEHISLKALTHSKLINTWVSPNNELFVQISVASDIVTELIQNNSKLLFKVNQNLYKNFLSNRAKKEINIILEK